MWIVPPVFQVRWPGSGGNEKFFFENETVSSETGCKKLRLWVFQWDWQQDSICIWFSRTLLLHNCSPLVFSGVHDFQCGRAESGGVQQQRDPGTGQNRVHESSSHQVGPVTHSYTQLVTHTHTFIKSCYDAGGTIANMFVRLQRKNTLNRTRSSGLVSNESQDEIFPWRDIVYLPGEIKDK